MKPYRYNILVFSIVALAGCTTGRDLVRDETVTIQRIDSRSAYIKSVSIKQFDKEVALAGVVKLRHSGRGTVRDHVDVRLTSQRGDVLHEQEISDYRLNRKRGEASFRITINEVSQTGSLLQLRLRNPVVHE